ncbi:hypothetical protein OAV88_00630 [bacterium]|nr:hypothetical protein [bacterium]
MLDVLDDNISKCWSVIFNKKKLNFDGYDNVVRLISFALSKLSPSHTHTHTRNKQWPQAFAVCSLNALGAGGDGKGCQWSCLYMMLRFIFFAWTFGVLVASVMETDCAATWPLYLTHITLVFQTVYLFFAMYTTWVGRHYVRNLKEAPKGPWYVRVTWLMFSVNIPATFLVFVLYWFLVVPNMAGSPSTLSYFTHGFNFLIAVLDMWLSKVRLYIVHVLYFVIYAFIYLVLSLIFWASGARTCSLDCGISDNNDNTTCVDAGDGVSCMWNATSGVCYGGDDGGNNYLYSALDFNRGASTWLTATIILFFVVPVIHMIFTFIVYECRFYGEDLDVNPDMDEGETSFSRARAERAHKRVEMA